MPRRGNVNDNDKETDETKTNNMLMMAMLMMMALMYWLAVSARRLTGLALADLFRPPR